MTLKTDTAGNQLQEASDVKVRGVIVGDVRKVDPSAEGATIELAINPDYLDQIPADVTARLLPKTLFGERFVALECRITRLRAPGRRRRHRSGPQRERDRAAEGHRRHAPAPAGRQPQDLSYTLGAVADALRGRGKSLGENLASPATTSARSTRCCRNSSPTSPSSPISPTPTRVPRRTCSPSSTTSRSRTRPLVDQQAQLRRTFTVVDASSNVTAGFLEANEQNLISLARPHGRCSGSSRSTRPSTRACSTA